MELSTEAKAEIKGFLAEEVKALPINPETATKAELKLAAEALATFQTEANSKIAKLAEQNDTLSGQLKAMPTKSNEPEYVTLEVALKKAFEANKKKVDECVAAKTIVGGQLVLEVGTKAVDITTGNTIGSGATQYLLTRNTGIISTIRKREERYLSVVSVGTIDSQRALWVEEYNELGTPIFIAEGTAKTQLSVSYREKDALVKKIGVFAKVTMEMLADLPQLISYIQSNLIRRVSLATETQLISGDGLNDNLNGVTSYATTFTAGDLAGTVEFANEFDALVAIALQVQLAFGEPNAIFMNPVTWAKMQTIKSEVGEPIWRDYVMPGSGDMPIINGMKIIPTTAITSGDFIGGDFTVVHVLYREGLTVQIGNDGNDFTNNKKTILVEQRLVQFVSANDTQVLVKGDFITAQAALNGI